MKVLIVVIWLAVGLVHSLELEQIRQRMQGQQVAWSDTIEVKAKVLMQVQGQDMQMTMHRITMGQTREWLEIKGAGMHSRVQRYGNKQRVTNMLTGNVENIDLPSALLNLGQSPVVGVLDSGSWSMPVVDGDLWRISSETTTLWWDNQRGVIVRMQQVIAGVQVESVMEYCDDCTVKHMPMRIVTATSSGAGTFKQEIIFEKIAPSHHYPANFFEF
jgi:hypothetical protein